MIVELKYFINRRRPFFWAEAFIASYLVIFNIAAGPVARLATLCGLLAVFCFAVELLLKNQIPSVVSKTRPIVPFALFALFTLIVLPLIPYAHPRVWNSFTGFLLIAVVFSIVRRNGSAPLIEIAPMLGVYFICGIYLLAPGLMGFGAQGADRMRFGIEALGHDDRGMGASGISLIVGVALFFGLRLWFSSQFRNVSLFRSPLKLFLCAGLALGVYAVVGFSGSRQGLIWIALAVAAFVAMKTRRNIFFSAMGAGAVGVLVIGFVLFFFRDLAIVERILVLFDLRMQALDPERSFMGRQFLIQAGFQMWTESPLWGHGNEAFRVSFGKYSHNNYIELLANYGLIGFTLFYLPMLIAFFGALRRAVTAPLSARAQYIWIVMSLLAIFASNMFLPSYYMRPMLILFSFIVGYYAFLESVPAEQQHPTSGYIMGSR